MTTSLYESLSMEGYKAHVLAGTQLELLNSIVKPCIGMRQEPLPCEEFFEAEGHRQSNSLAGCCSSQAHWKISSQIGSAEMHFIIFINRVTGIKKIVEFPRRVESIDTWKYTQDEGPQSNTFSSPLQSTILVNV